MSSRGAELGLGCGLAEGVGVDAGPGTLAVSARVPPAVVTTAATRSPAGEIAGRIAWVATPATTSPEGRATTRSSLALG